MKFSAFLLAFAVIANAQAEEDVRQMHRRLVELKTSTTTGNLRGAPEKTRALLDALDKMPVPKPAKKTTSG